MTAPDIHASPLGPDGEACRGCGALLAPDQRYCLNCGARRASAALRFLDEPGTAAAVGAGPTAPRSTPGPASRTTSFVGAATPEVNDTRTLVTIAAVATMLLALGLGILIGNAGDGSDDQPQVITVAGTPAAAPVAAAPVAAFVSDWPADRTGFTVQLQLLPKASTDAAAVAAAKADAIARGVAGPGALDTDAHPGLPAGNYLVFSGSYEDRDDAESALSAVSSAFPDAQVVEVTGTGAPAKRDASATETPDAEAASDSGSEGGDAETVPDTALDAGEKLSPDEFQRRSEKLPEQIETEGAPPPVDDAAPGAGSDAEVIG